MVYSMSATPFSTVSQDSQQNEINGFHAAPVFQHNYAITFNKTTFLIDQKISQIIRFFFEEMGAENVTLTGIGSESLELKASRSLTSKIFESILEFYRKGAVSSQIEADTLNICQENHFLLFYFYLNHMLQSSGEELFGERSFLSVFDKLEVAALRQEVEIFFQLLKEYLQTLQKEGLHSEQGLKEQCEEPLFTQEEREKEDEEAGFAKIFSEMDLWDRRELAKLLIHFEPKAFEKLACIIRSQWKLLYEEAVKVYVQVHCYCLDDLIHEARDEQLKWDLISYVPELNARLVWFSQLKAEAPVEIVKKAVINPLIALGRLEEALEWASKINDIELIKQVTDQCKEKTHLSSLSSDSSYEELESFCFEENAWIKCVSSPGALGEIDFDSSLQTPLEFIRVEIKHQVTRFQEAKNLYELARSGKAFIRVVETLLQKELNHGWTQELLVFAIQCYIDEIMERGAEQYARQMKKKCSDVTSYGEQLHPALMEDLQIIKKFIGLTKKGLTILFGSNEMKMLLLEQVDLLSENQVADALIACARRLFQKRFSLREDFIVQEVSNYFLPHFFNPKNWYESTSVQPFMEHLEERLENAKLGQKLSAHEIILAKEIFIRKSVEIANYQYNPLGESKLNPYKYDIKRVEKGLFHCMKEIIQKALQENFRKVDLRKLPQQQREAFKGAPLLREIFLQANHAEFKVYMKL